MQRYLIIIFFFFILFPRSILAESAYVLPYPSVMPGSIFYNLNLIQDELLRFWYFGDFGQFKYNLSQSDKYLIEAKTLLEYKQYFLGWRALVKSNEYFEKISPPLIKAKSHGKNISEKNKTLKVAKEKHIEVLSKIQSEVPEFVEWKPEKEKSSNLDLWNFISYSMKIRQGGL